MGQLNEIEKKIVTLPQLADRLQHNHLGEWIVFAYGCFDLLHAGHIAYLSKARDLGGVLVVGVNSDHSIKQLKGEQPFMDEQNRALLLASLQCVDYVTIFDEETPHDIIQTIIPDVMVRSENHISETFLDATLVQNHGGQVFTISDTAEQSSECLIKKIQSVSHPYASK